MKKNKTIKKQVIVIGGGFAGVQFVKKLDARIFDVLLIDKINHYQFQPLFYQVAAGQLEPSSISFPLRNIFRNKINVQIRLAEALSIDRKNNLITTSVGAFPYDYLVIAIGCKTNFYGNDHVSKYALTLKSTSDAISIRNHILQTFEKIISADKEEKESLLNLVIVGAGPTGVELAGAFAEIKKHVLPKDYPKINFSRFKIILVEGSKYTLKNMSGNAKAASRKYLREMGVDILSEAFVKSYDGETLTLDDGNTIRTKSLIWTAGVTGNTIRGLPDKCYSAGSRIKVDRINKVIDSDNIFALGDIAFMETPKYPMGHPQIANVAVNQGRQLAWNLKKIIQHKAPVNYEYVDYGTMATIGKNKAVIDLPFFEFKGYFAWVIWMLVHLKLIFNIKNKLIIIINWIWNYIAKDTSLNLIIINKKDNTI